MIPYIIIAVLAVILAAVGILNIRRILRFRPNPDKAEQQRLLNDDLKAAGFAYDMKCSCFYSLHDCWQRSAGYCRLYDEGSLLFNMAMDCEPITFVYKGKRWLIEFWKGQYGITTGAEIGVYNTDRDDIHSEKFTGTFYDAASDEEQLEMSFILKKNGRIILKRKDRHWWLTGFLLGEFSEKESLTMDAEIKFPDKQMLTAFTDALAAAGYKRDEYSAHFKTVKLHYAKPHTPQPLSQDGVQEDAVQLINKNNCTVFQIATDRYSCTLDKLEYLREFMPELYDFAMRSLYGREFFAAFEWLIKLIKGSKSPLPPKPQKPQKCPPCPPCPPVMPELHTCDRCRVSKAEREDTSCGR